jgi:hypothetical protein
LSQKEETLEIIITKPLRERLEEQYRRLLEEGLIETSSLACYDPKEINTKTLKEALRRCKAKLKTLTPKPIKGIPFFVYCVDPRCLEEQVTKIIKERLELEHH